MSIPASIRAESADDADRAFTRADRIPPATQTRGFLPRGARSRSRRSRRRHRWRTSSNVPMGGGNTSIQIVIEGRPGDAAGRRAVAPTGGSSAPAISRRSASTCAGATFDDRETQHWRQRRRRSSATRWPSVTGPASIRSAGNFYRHSTTRSARLTIVGVGRRHQKSHARDRSRRRSSTCRPRRSGGPRAIPDRSHRVRSCRASR